VKDFYYLLKSGSPLRTVNRFERLEDAIAAARKSQKIIECREVGGAETGRRWDHKGDLLNEGIDVGDLRPTP
jgi:hypothetical protein